MIKDAIIVTTLTKMKNLDFIHKIGINTSIIRKNKKN